MGVSRFARSSIAETDADRIDCLFRSESARAVASLARTFNDFDRAEDAVQDAYAVALTRWPREGIPQKPAAWIVATARNSAIDRLRREKVALSKYERLAGLENDVVHEDAFEVSAFDDRLAMIFAACHPALSEDTRIALTLRFAAGLTVPEIATALLASQPTIAQRLVRAKRKIRDAQIPFHVPDGAALSQRLRDVLRIVYLIFNEGYASATATNRVREELCDEALRLVTLLGELLPNEPEIQGLHALCIFHDVRRPTRVDTDGEIVLLEHQDRTKWDARKIVQGLTLLERAFRHRAIGSYQLQAAIAAEHVRVPMWGDTNWFRIREWYDALLELEPSPVIELNRAVAIAYTDGPQSGLAIVDGLIERGELGGYAPLFAARAELFRKLNRREEARRAYEQALEVTSSDSEGRLLRRQLKSL